MPNVQDEAPCVLLAVRPLDWRMQNMKRYAVLLPALSGLHDAHRDAARLDGGQGLTDGGQLAASEARRASHAADGEAVEERNESVEVVEVGVREHDVVDPPDAPAPQERRDVSAGHVRAGRA